ETGDQRRQQRVVCDGEEVRVGVALEQPAHAGRVVGHARGGVGPTPEVEHRLDLVLPARADLHRSVPCLAVAAPVQKDQELELEVESLAYGGNGVARLEGFVVFVRRGLPGDTVRARVTKVKRNHAEALAVVVLEPGPERVEAPCAHYPACGGCRFQDLAYESQLAQKQAEGGGYLRHLVVREGRNTGQTLVQLVTAAGEKFDRDYLIETLRRFPEVKSIHWSVNDSPAEVTNLPTELLWGENAIEEELCGLRFRVRPNAFLQTNTAMAERLYELAGEYAALTGNEAVYDLYCGIGTIGLTPASRALTVWG